MPTHSTSLTPSLSLLLILMLSLCSVSFQVFDCKNHVRVIQSMQQGDRLYVCGTNAHNPKDYVIYVSTQRHPQLPLSFSLPPSPTPAAALICLFSLVKDKFLWLWQRKFLKRFSAKSIKRGLVRRCMWCAGVCVCQYMHMHVCVCVDFRSQSWMMHTQSNACGLFICMNCIEQDSTLCFSFSPLLLLPCASYITLVVVMSLWK